MLGESCPPTPPNKDAIHPHRKQWGILSCFREANYVRKEIQVGRRRKKVAAGTEMGGDRTVCGKKPLRMAR